MSIAPLSLQIRWSDLDPNFHVRHSVYYDWGALSRIEYFYKNGVTADMMARLHFGPIIFREESVFRKEIRLGDEITIDLEVIKARADYSRWTIRHTIRKSGDTMCATVTVDGAWIDTSKRKLTIPPEEAIKLFDSMPKAADFVLEG